MWTAELFESNSQPSTWVWDKDVHYQHSLSPYVLTSHWWCTYKGEIEAYQPTNQARISHLLCRWPSLGGTRNYRRNCSQLRGRESQSEQITHSFHSIYCSCNWTSCHWCAELMWPFPLEETLYCRLESFANKASEGWKWNALSFAGRTTLTKSVPMHFMVSCPM